MLCIHGALERTKCWTCLCEYCNRQPLLVPPVLKSSCGRSALHLWCCSRLHARGQRVFNMIPGQGFVSNPLIGQWGQQLQQSNRGMAWNTPPSQQGYFPATQQYNAAAADDPEVIEYFSNLAGALAGVQQPQITEYPIPEYQSTELLFFSGLMGDSQHILGAGSYAQVLWAFSKRDDQHVAVKQLHPAVHGDIKREFTLQNMCKHDYVAAVKGCVKLAGAWAMIMEKCVCSLQDAVYAVHLPRAPQQPQQQPQQQCYMGSGVFQAITGDAAAEDVARQVDADQERADAKGLVEDFGTRLMLLTHIAAAVHHIHTASQLCNPPKPCILHNDIRALNVLLDIKSTQSTQPGGQQQWVAKVTDFGLAAELQPSQGREAPVEVEQHTHALWAAPEMVHQVGGRHFATLKSDIFSFGQLVQEVLTGHPPYTFAPNDNRSVNDRACYMTNLLQRLMAVPQVAAHRGTHPPSTQDHVKEWKKLRHSCGEILSTCIEVLRPRRPVPQGFCGLIDSCRKLTPCKRPTAAQVLQRLQQIKQEYTSNQVGHVQAPATATAVAPAAPAAAPAAAALATTAAPATVPTNNPGWDGRPSGSPMDWVVGQPQGPVTGLAAAGF